MECRARMTIKNKDFIFLDFQTTGTVAARSEIVEAGWGLYRADSDIRDLVWTTHLVALPEERALSRTIQKITGLSADYYRESPSISADELKENLARFLDDNKTTPIVMHYAQFKIPFLLKVLGEDSESALRIICVHRLAKRLRPGLKAYSLRAVAGFMGYATAEKKRSHDHLTATATIWRDLSSSIPVDEIPSDLVAWLKTYTPSTSTLATLPLHDQELRKKRLALPHMPGVYFFLDSFDKVLYVGKAADLHHRVNSYFRGRKTKGSRLNEMLTRAVGFRYVEVRSELEALIRENDEIKQIDPPYNRLLRVEGRSLAHFCFNKLMPDPKPWGHRTYGPTSSLWMLDAIRLSIEGDPSLPLAPGYRKGLTKEIIQEATFRLFRTYDMSLDHAPNPEDWHHLALKAWPLEHARLLEKQLRVEDDASPLELEPESEVEPGDDSTEENGDKVWTAEDLELFLGKAFLSLYRQILRSRWYLRLSHSMIEWQFHSMPDVTHRFTVIRGMLQEPDREVEMEAFSYNERLAGFDLKVYDRIRILYAELKKGLKRGDLIRLHLGPKLVLSEAELKRLVRP